MREKKFRAWDILENRMYEDAFFGEIVQQPILMEHINGIKDINNKKIYEGDIVEDKLGKKWIILYDNKLLAFVFYILENKSIYRLISAFDKKKELPLKIIGNIFEWPEDLKKIIKKAGISQSLHCKLKVPPQ